MTNNPDIVEWCHRTATGIETDIKQATDMGWLKEDQNISESRIHSAKGALYAAADEITRLRAEVRTLRNHGVTAQEEIERLREKVRLFEDAVRVDATMGGPQYIVSNHKFKKALEYGKDTNHD